MPKISTDVIQDYICSLGEELGFISRKEVQFRTCQNSYNPIYDVVWFLDLSPFNISPLKSFIDDDDWIDMMDPVPIASFEIEGANTSSKNQVSNFMNLIIGPSLFNFIIVNNEGAINECDTYRRGVKIYRSIREIYGDKNFIFADWTQIQDILSELSLSKSEREITVSPTYCPERSAYGGENKSQEIAQSVLSIVHTSRMQVYQNYTPEYFSWHYSHIRQLHSIDCSNKENFIMRKSFISDPRKKNIKPIKNIKDYYYLPKVDIAVGFYLPPSFRKFLYLLGIHLEYESVNYPLVNYILNFSATDIFFPYLGIEVEGSINKHFNGGVFNCAKYFFTGVIISEEPGSSHVNTFKNNLGLNNLFFNSSVF